MRVKHNYTNTYKTKKTKTVQENAIPLSPQLRNYPTVTGGSQDLRPDEVRMPDGLKTEELWIWTASKDVKHRSRNQLFAHQYHSVSFRPFNDQHDKAGASH